MISLPLVRGAPLLLLLLFEYFSQASKSRLGKRGVETAKFQRKSYWEADVSSFTGGSAAAAGDLVKQLGGSLIGYLFIVEIPFLKGRDKLDNVPVVTLLDVNE